MSFYGYQFSFASDVIFANSTEISTLLAPDAAPAVVLSPTKPAVVDKSALFDEIDAILNHEAATTTVDQTDEEFLAELNASLGVEKPVATASSKKRTFTKAGLAEAPITATITYSASSLVAPAVTTTNRHVKRPKRAKPFFVYSDELHTRIKNYWHDITHHPHYQYVTKKWHADDLDESKAKLLLDNIIPALLPNGVTVDYFKYHQGIDGWYYKANNKRNSAKLPMRWCGQELNFYDTFVTRHKLDNHGKVIQKQGLCPYCPLDKGSVNFDIIFHNTQDSLYMHHVCKDHGVYSTGYELSPPLIAYDSGAPAVVCTECGERCSMFNIGNGFKNSMIAYFRHAFSKHNKKKHNRSNVQKKHDEYFFNGVKDLYYEQQPSAISNLVAPITPPSGNEILFEERLLEDAFKEDILSKEQSPVKVNDEFRMEDFINKILNEDIANEDIANEDINFDTEKEIPQQSILNDFSFEASDDLFEIPEEFLDDFDHALEAY